VRKAEKTEEEKGLIIRLMFEGKVDSWWISCLIFFGFLQFFMLNEFHNRNFFSFKKLCFEEREILKKNPPRMMFVCHDNFSASPQCFICLPGISDPNSESQIRRDP
jgi:hypothetical protein